MYDGSVWKGVRMKVKANHMTTAQVGSKCYFIGGFDNIEGSLKGTVASL